MYTTQLGLRLQSSLQLISSSTSKLTSRIFSHRSLNVLAARLKADFGLCPAVVTLMLRITAAEEHAVIVKGKTLGAEEGDEVAVVPEAAERPACCKIGVACADDIVGVSLTGLVLHDASVRR